MELEDVGRARDHAHAAEAPLVLRPLLSRGVVERLPQDDVVPEAPVAEAPKADRVEEDGDGRVGDLAGGQGLSQELALELQREVAARGCCEKGKKKGEVNFKFKVFFWREQVRFGCCGRGME